MNVQENAIEDLEVETKKRKNHQNIKNIDRNLKVEAVAEKKNEELHVPQQNHLQ
jgi:hypothetical protein